MHIETLKVFRDLVETGSFSKTAELNYISQSAVSQQIKNLEFVLKCSMLVRQTGKIVLTPCGEKFYEVSKKVVLLYHNTIISIRQASTPRAASAFKVSTIYSAGIYLLQEYVRKFLTEHPDTRIEVEYRQFQQIQSDIMSGRSDLGIIAGPCHKQRNIVMCPFGEDRMVLLTGMSDGLSKKRLVAVQEIAGMNFIIFDKGSPSRRCVDNFFRKHGVTVNIRMELDDVETIKTAVSSGLGLSILPLSAIRQEERDRKVHIIHFNDAKIARPLHLIYNQSRTLPAPAQAFLALVQGEGNGNNSVGSNPARRNRSGSNPKD